MEPQSLGRPGWTYVCARREGAQWWVAQGFRTDTPAALPLITQGAANEEEAVQGLREQAAIWDDQYGSVTTA
jgi:hypothetical protein